MEDYRKHKPVSGSPQLPPLDKNPRVPQNITKSRINNFMSGGGQFYSMGVHQALWKARYKGEPHVKLSVYSVPNLKRITFEEAMAGTYKEFKQNETTFGPSWSTHWFKVTIVIPELIAGEEVVFQWDMQSEGMIWSTDGVPLQGLTGGTAQSRHEYVLTRNANPGQDFTFYLEAACNGMFGVGDQNDAMVPDPNRYFRLIKADLVVPSHEIQDLYHDLDVVRGIAYNTNEDSVRARNALWTLNEVINQFIADDPKTWKQCKSLTSEFLSSRNGKGQHKVTALGNCHIDTAWLWPYEETKRKIARSWSTQLDLMNKYPDYIFTASQAQQYEWLKDLYPPLFKKIQKKEKDGQWEIIGGSWVEHDTNMPSGESLCRQMLLGQRFFEKYFGKRTKIFWLPDSFVLKQSGCDYFFTQKLSWNNINTFPLTTFWWTGIDNSRILAHLTPAETHGDGGGGPTPDMLERLKRMKDVYLEFHRGTYTTQALVKQGNRKGEVLLRDLEIISTMAAVLQSNPDLAEKYIYPADSITHLWKLLCLNQFHDCLPGSAIGMAYTDVHKALLLRHKAQSYIINSNRREDNYNAVDQDEENGFIVFNTLSWKRSEVLAAPKKKFSDDNTADNEDDKYIIAYETEDGNFMLENSNLKAKFNSDGQLIELIDERVMRGNLVSPGERGNTLVLYEDVPTYWDAWDVEIYHFQKRKTIEGSKSVQIVSKGPIKAELKFRQNISDRSCIEQTISLTCIGERIEFNNVVEWNESHKFLKVEFPWDLVTDHATYDIQHGVVRRSNHYNSTQDSAKFEVCGHKFSDLSEANYGVALINNCKYGYATQDNVQRLSLLRSPKGPDEHADMGQHAFKYAIYPHQGHFNNSNVVREAFEFNVPLSIRYAKGNAFREGVIVPSLFEISTPGGVIIDTIKLAEDDKGKAKTVILRLFEAYGGKQTVLLSSSLDIKSMEISNILEDNGEKLQPTFRSSFVISLTPFQILTLKATLN
ncbi:glycoside hydrolase family 38 protein [Phycomyces blakesleeanus NRRL 1555(-)]|uniref:alpha-mannosidase n=1 Tax=Phycomyces blakesleeanus (strain ATCC 8743b / DSM 1359 / FGSC 10004 / NBRC 33097 / NRRL 1555) TaxID=763407 RepID=A0A163D7M4_PHYB8|nr:glycoside hydrolase family 38 protein [Phycomyces blakesleeanus NRRL 1555(-)]OAD69350.1 glycoside hydrolase family 38 protein [Phycomyces blakesleeanus NRRL 1555(-)]|eukprot:XP_018287390.1 glycoside hydrolase family 38 protein [Phycomyces blakesleeanus NRRL 1555(-)]